MTGDPAAEIRPDQIILATECYLGDWQHSIESAKRAVDAKATFFFADDADMRPLTAHQTRAGQGKREPGKRFRMYLVEIEDAVPDAEPVAPPEPYAETVPIEWGQYARDLKLSGFLRAPDVWRVLGSDGVFRDWVTYQPSIVSGAFSEHDSCGEGRNVACHVRRAGEAGTAYKPAYACVPMTDAEHQIQHQSGEAAIYARALALQGKQSAITDPGEQARQWFDEQRIKTVERWAWETLREVLGVASMKYADPDAVFEWADAEGVAYLLPRCYRDSPT